MKSLCSLYFAARIIIGFLDIVCDSLLSAALILEGHIFWASLVGGWVVLAVLSSVLTVVIRRWRRGEPLPASKYFLLSLKIHTEYGQAFFQSGPELVIQTALLWTGIYRHDFQTYVGDPSLNWAAAWLQVLSLLLSFISLHLTTLHYNTEPGPPARICSALFSNLVTSIYRVFLLSVMFVISPEISAGITLTVFLLSVTSHACLGDGALSFPQGFFSLFVPVGHNLAANIRAGSGIPEADRQKINHKSLQRRVEKVLTSHFVTSLLLLVPYCCLLEMLLHPRPDLPYLLPLLYSRYFTYFTAGSLTLLLLSSHLLYYRTVRQAREAARTWSGVNTSLISSPRQSSVRANTVGDPQLTSRPSSPSRAASPTRPVSQMYPYLPSAPAPSQTARESFPGGRRCEEEDCITCVWLVEGPNFRSNSTCRGYKLMTPVTCTDINLVYLVTCGKCHKQYVGSTGGNLRDKNAEHRADIERQDTLLGRHFASVCGYDNWTIQIIDKCERTELARRQRFWMDELVTRFPVGLNESQRV